VKRLAFISETEYSYRVRHRSIRAANGAAVDLTVGEIEIEEERLRGCAGVFVG